MIIRLEDAIAFGYPGGEQQVRLTASQIADVLSADHIGIFARIKNSEDLIRTVLLSDAVDNINPLADVSVILPYLPYGRADRRFVEGDCFGLEIFGRILETTGVWEILTLDAHSHKELSSRLTDVNPEVFIGKSAVNFSFRAASDKINILYPDKGAAERYSLPVDFGCNIKSVAANYLYAEKQRDPATGKLLGFKVPDLAGLPTLIVDDICDGGGTFLGISEEVYYNTAGKPPFMGLYTTHGIYSKGTEILLKHFDVLYTTNSFAERLDTDRIVVYDCLPTLFKELV